MATLFGDTTGPFRTRRSPRYLASLPVLISSKTDGSTVAVPGLTSEISQSGMAVYGGLPLQPGDLIEVEFQTSDKPRVAGIVRNRSGFCFGLEFVTAKPSSDAEPTTVSPSPTVEDVLQLAELHAEENAPERTWITEHRGDVAIALASIFLLLALFGGVTRLTSNLAPAQDDRPSLTLVERMLVNLGLAEPPPTPAVIHNPGAKVWVDVHTALYYCSGSELYGRTPGGRFTTQRDARLDQFEPAAGNWCQ